MSWALNNARLFVLGCTNLIAITDHKPLLGIYKDRELNTIFPTQDYNPWRKKPLLTTLLYHCPGKWHQGPDAVSCHPVHQIIPSYDSPTQKDLNHAYAIKNQNQEVISQSLRLINEPNATPPSTIANIDGPVIIYHIAITKPLQRRPHLSNPYTNPQWSSMEFPQWRMIY